MKKKRFVISNVIAAFGFSLVLLFAAPTVFAGGGNANHIAVFLGVTDGKETDFTGGIEYERRLPILHEMFGVGLTYERVFAEEEIDLYLLNIIAHPWKGLKINVSPGREKEKGHSSESLFRYGIASLLSR